MKQQVHISTPARRLIKKSFCSLLAMTSRGISHYLVMIESLFAYPVLEGMYVLPNLVVPASYELHEATRKLE